MHSKIIISGGGTGGHVYPAIAIATAIKRLQPEAEILFVGAKGKLEMDKVPQAGYQIEGLWISGFQRKLTFRNLMFPFKLLSSLMKATRIIRRFKPDVVVGVGGYASGPVLEMATRLKIPTLIQEQNSYAGVTNRLLAKKVNKICVAYEGLERFFPNEKIVLTGNPVRKDILKEKVISAEAIGHFNLDKEVKTLLVLGGSLGAQAVNELMASRLDFFENLRVQVIWQCGQLYYERYKHLSSEKVKVLAYIDRMDLGYAAADVIISRAGAGSVSELAIVGKPVMFIPSPNVAEDHQTKNAEAIVNKNAAYMIKQSELEDKFDSQIEKLFNDVELRKSLTDNLEKLAKPNATADIIEEISKIIEK